MPSPSDVWANEDARALLLALADRGVQVTVRVGCLDVRPASRVTPDEVRLLHRHKPALLALALLTDERCVDRLLAMRRGDLAAVASTDAGRCYLCLESLPMHRTAGRCGWCATAARLYAGAPVPAGIVDLFGPEITGTTHPGSTSAALPLDLAVPHDSRARCFLERITAL